jgi:hypothetical protein
MQRPFVLLATAAVGALVGAAAMWVAPRPAADQGRITRADGRPNMSGIWQANNEAHWDLEAHEARPGMVTQPGVYSYEYARVPAAPVLALGAAAGVPGSLGVVDGDGKIPYRPEAATLKQENAANWIDRDPELKCYLPGLPRATYMPYPFEITQSTDKVHMAYTFAGAARTIHLDTVDGPPAEGWMGHSVGRWDGDTLVVTVADFNDKTWLDRAGNHHSDALKLEERYTLVSPDVIRYDATIEDPKVYTRPWRISMPLYRRVEPRMQLLEYRCTEFVEEFMYGHVRKKPLVTSWEGETMRVDITRKVPTGDRFYEWYRR